MAFSASNLSISLEFDLTNAPKDFTLTDATDYSAETYSDIYGLLKAIAPSGTQFYNNTNYASPDIDYNSSPTSAALGSLPLVSSLVETGTYQFTYTVKLVDMLQSHTIISNDSGAKTFTINGNYATQILSSTAANWECVDAVTTALTIVSATYSASTGLTTVTINETLGALTALAQFQFTVDVIFSKNFSQSYTYESPSVCLNWVNDECCSSMTITDVTVYPDDATVTRLHTVHYPDGMVTPIADVTSPLQEFTITPIWTGTWTDTFTADIEAENGIISIVDEIRGVKEHKVTGSDGLCQVYACMQNMSDKYTAYLTTAPQKALEMQKYITQASAAFMAYTVGKKCGETDYEQYLENIVNIAASCDCGCDCGDCADGTPTQVVGCCENVGSSDFTILIISTNGSLTISSNTVGDTTTFDIEINSTWLNTQIANIFAATSIGELSDVDVTTAVPATGQTLVWNNGTGKWERSTVQVELLQLTDVDDTGLADEMILYYDAGTQTFKFRLETAPSIAACTDVSLLAPASGQILKYNGTDWTNQDNNLSTMMDVNTTGRVDGSGLEWDTGTSKWIMTTLKKTLASLDDCDIDDTNPLTDLDRLQYNEAGTIKWNNVPIPTFVDTSVTYNTDYYGDVGTIFDFGYSYDPITNEVTLRGGVRNDTGGAVAGPVTLLTLPISYAPAAEIPFLCTVGYGAINAVAFGRVSSGGVMSIFYYIDPSNPSLGNISGIPAGDIALSTTIKYQKTP